jgi:hypothetical protein
MRRLKPFDDHTHCNREATIQKLTEQRDNVASMLEEMEEKYADAVELLNDVAQERDALRARLEAICTLPPPMAADGSVDYKRWVRELHALAVRQALTQPPTEEE